MGKKAICRLCQRVLNLRGIYLIFSNFFEEKARLDILKNDGSRVFTYLFRIILF